jgi:alpha-mannosidase
MTIKKMIKALKTMGIVFCSLVILSKPCFSQFQESNSNDTLAKMNLHIVPQSHIDLSWWWRYDPEAIHVIAKHTLETAFENMEKFPDYTFTYLQVPMIEPLEGLCPELYYKLRYYVHNKEAVGSGYPNPGASGDNGRLAIGSAMWCEVDGSLPCGESLVRQCLYGKRYYKIYFGIDVKTAWVQDAWTHPWTYPQILKKSGIVSYMYTRPRPEERFMLVPDSLQEKYLTTMSKTPDERMFWWEAPDGSRVFAYKPLSLGGENLPSNEAIENYLTGLHRKYGVSDGITLIGVGNHGGGAIREDVERMRRVMNERNSGNPQEKKQAALIFSNPKQFTSAILDHPGSFPVIKDELVPTIRGAYTTVGEIKKGNRHSETLLMTLEKFASVASVMNRSIYPEESIYDAWKKLMINQFHDPISGTDINPSIDDVLLRFQQIHDSASNLLNLQLRAISGNINTNGEGIPLVIFNPLSWVRTDIAETEFELAGDINQFSLYDDKNERIPYQVIERISEKDKNKIKIIFVAQNIPSMGYSLYRLKRNKGKSQINNNLSIDRFFLENEFYSVRIDSMTGCISGLTDKQNNREILLTDSRGNLIQVIDDHGDSEGFLMSPEGFGEFYNWTGKTSDIINFSEIKVIENGPVRTVIQIKRSYDLARFIQRIYLYEGINKIDFELIIDWNGKNKMVKVAFPLDVQNDSAVYEIPYGTIKRPNLGEEQVAQQWVDLSDDYYGVSLLNDSRYGYDINNNTIRLSVLRSPDHPVEATDEKGIHQVRYSLYPHIGTWYNANTMQKAYEFNYPLIVLRESTHSGSMPSNHSFIDVSPENIMVTVLKKTEDSDDLIIRFYETHGIECIAKIKLSPLMGIDAVHKTDLLENEIENIPMIKNEFETKVGKFSIETFKLIKDLY